MKILELFKQKDKQKHLIVGFIISLFCGLCSHWSIGIAVASLAGAVKEFYDMTGRGTPEFADFVMTMVGGIIGGVFTVIISLLI